MIRIKNKKEKIELFLFILGVIGIIVFKVFDNKSNREIFQNQGYAIGVLTQLDKSKAYVSWVPNANQLTIKTPTVTFTYYVNDSTFIGNYGSDTYPINENLAITGKKYLVVYNKKKPHDGRILLNYPIRDSLEFKNTIRAFTLNPERFNIK
jgi:hypothetical protein